ncbi:hypothetical protein [Kroppenstedtia guangzhouensis]|nr:hypothetical protein [Kroppenstedtia guangzhouensis]
MERELCTVEGDREGRRSQVACSGCNGHVAERSLTRDLADQQA